MFGNKRFDVDDVDNIITDGVWYAGTLSLQVDFQENFRRFPLHERRYALVEYTAGDECAQTQSFTGPIIEQQGIQVQIRNCIVDVNHT